MNTPAYLTLADAHNAEADKIDSIIRASVYQAALDVGNTVVIAALCNPTRPAVLDKAA